MSSSRRFNLSAIPASHPHPPRIRLHPPRKVFAASVLLKTEKQKWWLSPYKSLIWEMDINLSSAQSKQIPLALGKFSHRTAFFFSFSSHFFFFFPLSWMREMDKVSICRTSWLIPTVVIRRKLRLIRLIWYFFIQSKDLLVILKCCIGYINTKPLTKKIVFHTALVSTNLRQKCVFTYLKKKKEKLR